MNIWNGIKTKKQDLAMKSEKFIRGKMWRTPKYKYLEKYLVNEYGDLISLRGRKPKLMKRQTYKIGYQYYPIQVGKRNVKIKVHRIVAKTFLEEKEGKNLVNHKDGDKTNNYIGNLEWCSNSENILHAYNVLGSKHGGKKCKQVRCIETGEIFKSVSDAARAKNTFRSSIRKVINGTQNNCGGYTWEDV